MLEERNLIYFNPFYFPDGKSAPKEKYFIVLKNQLGTNILASLPTRKDNVPQIYDGDTGCISLNQKDHGFDMVCYRIEPQKEILENSDFHFDFNTHIYGSNLKLYQMNYFDLYPHEGVDYMLLGKIKNDIFRDLINCLKNNNAVKLGYRRLL
jgi:hypothetical protein